MAIQRIWYSARRYSSSVSMNGDIGFVGMGNMGSRMARNLIRYHKEHNSTRRVLVYDKFPNGDVMKGLEAEGGVLCPSLESDLIPSCSVFISMLPSSPHVFDLYTKSILPVLSSLGRTRSLLIDSSTIDPKVSLQIHRAAAEHDQLMLDAPVSGGITGAENGTLTFMVGGPVDHTTFEGSLRDVFSPMGKAVLCGGPSIGQSVKVCNNLILGAQMLGVAEGYSLAERLGVDLAKFNEIVNSSTGKCWATEKYNPVPGLMQGVPADRGYKGGFMTDLMVKDLGLAIEAAGGSPLPVTEFSRSEYTKIQADGNGSLDFGYAYQMYRQKK
jgi:3-hydroxyisobutyrate dehydrogenase